MPHPLSRQVWDYAGVRDHWDEIEARSWNTDASGRHLYQEGKLDAFMRVEDLLRELRQMGYEGLDGSLIFGGTIPTLGGFIYGSHFEAELYDPKLDRRLTCSYQILPSPAAAGEG
jgi:hypothetical protein